MIDAEVWPNTHPEVTRRLEACECPLMVFLELMDCFPYMERVANRDTDV